MRVLLLAALLLLPASMPAQAHAGHALGLEMTGLELVFDPLTQSSQLRFRLANNDTGRTGALLATVTLVDGELPTTVRVSSAGLLPGEEGDFVASVEDRVIVRGCILVYGTAAGQPAKNTGQECVQTSGLSAAPMPLPVTIPAVTEL